MLYIFIALALLAVALIVAKRSNEAPLWITDTVSKGTVRNIISVSGVIDAVESAELAFPESGTLESVNVEEGDEVVRGQVLARLSHNDLKADYQDAYAALLIAEANRDELVSGLRPEERDVAKTNVAIAKEDLERTIKEQRERVENAYRTLLSSDLEARPDKSSNDDTPPVVSGTYSCEKEGVYVLDVYSSSARSGFSYRLSGLESGTYTAYTESPSPLGSCGLSIQFIAGESYSNSIWSIIIPNTESTSYITNLNAYELALTQEENAVREAEQDLVLAEQNQVLDTAGPRTEALSREEARVLQARARLAVVNAQIEKHILRAPFDGTVTHIDGVPGESLGTEPVITMVSDGAFALTALIPEIDVTKIAVGQKADVVFDAQQDEMLSATIIFISPLAKEIAGVSYFEAKLVLDEDVDWIRSGLNADIDLIVETREDVTRIPRRYLIEDGGKYTVLVPQGNDTKSVPVTVTFTGNDGFVEIKGLEVGATVIAP
jgi:multidrug efflux pump subunit AcrA (membrane-fusion protein)